MQGLWSNHRRTKINLNSVVGPVDDAIAQEGANTGGTTTPAEDAVAPDTMLTGQASPPMAGKRKVRRIVADGDERIVKRMKTNAISKDHTPPTARLSDLGGIQPCIEKMLELVAMPLCHPEVYLHTGIQPPRGVLLHGPPGCGKTLLANAIAGVCMSFLLFALYQALRPPPGARAPFHQCICTFNCLRHVRRI